MSSLPSKNLGRFSLEAVRAGATSFSFKDKSFASSFLNQLKSILCLPLVVLYEFHVGILPSSFLLDVIPSLIEFLLVLVSTNFFVVEEYTFLVMTLS